MQWSKLRKLLKAFICAELQGRLDIHVTSYPGSDIPSKGWMTLDGREICTFGGIRHRGDPSESKSLSDPLPGGRSRTDFLAGLAEYPQLSIEEALSSEMPIVRGFAMLDRRVGKRRLQGIQVGQSEDPLVGTLFGLRVSLDKKEL